MRWFSGSILFVLIFAVMSVLVIAGLSELSSREYLFLSILLTGLAIAVSWLATTLAYKASSDQMRETLKKEYSDNLRTYALKAAEKVQNLSQEIERLREYLHGVNITGESEDSKLAHESQY